MSLKEYLEIQDKVVLSVKMLYLVVGIGVIRTAMTVFRHIDVRSPNFLIITKLIVYAASIYLIQQINKGKNWARWSLVVLLTLSIPLTILPAFGQFSHNPVYAVLFFMQLVLYIVALVFLFQKSSSEYFKSEKPPK